MSRTKLSIYLDDTHYLPQGGFTAFLDFVSSEGLAGKASVILRYDGNLLAKSRTSIQESYLESVWRMGECNFDAHMEFMTHDKLWDFSAGTLADNGPHESIWVYEPTVSREVFRDYFGNIISEARKIGITYSGVSFPGCDCEDCSTRWAELSQAGIQHVNPELWQALLALAKKQEFAVPVVPCFVDDLQDGLATRLMAADAEAAIYDLRPDLEDRLGFFGAADPDFYINATGSSGKIVDLVRSGATRCIFNVHWEGINPVYGPGWIAFTEVIKRVQRHLRDDVEWMPPSAYAASLYGAERGA